MSGHGFRLSATSGRRLPWEFGPGVGLLAAVTVTVLLAGTDHGRSLGWSLAAFCVVTAAVGMLFGVRGGLATAVMAWCCLNAFLVNRNAELRWHGAADAWRVGALCVVAVASALPRGRVSSLE